MVWDCTEESNPGELKVIIKTKYETMTGDQKGVDVNNCHRDRNRF